MKTFVKSILGVFIVLSFIGCNTARAFDCSEIAGMAEGVMGARQAGVPMAKVYKAIGEDKFSSPVVNLHRAFVRAAYGVPRYSTEHMQEQAKSDFGSDAFMACIKSTE
jgi:hypothetical protein